MEQLNVDHTYSSRLSEPQESDLLQLVGFTIGRENFGVDILMVQEIIRSVRITAVPNSPGFIEGVINLRGSIIPVIDLRKRLNLHQDNGTRKTDVWILIIDVENRVTGFIVDSVTKVLKIQAGSVEPPPDIVTAGLHAQYIRGVCEIGERLLIMLDFTNILHVKEIRKLMDFDKES